MPKPKLSVVRIDVAMVDGATFTFDAWNVDLVAWDRERGKRGWPAADQAPFMWMNFLAWHHLTSTSKELPAMTLADFTTAARTIKSAADDDGDGDGDDVDPTNPEPGPG